MYTYATIIERGGVSGCKFCHGVYRHYAVGIYVFVTWCVLCLFVGRVCVYLCICLCYVMSLECMHECCVCEHE